MVADFGMGKKLRNTLAFVNDNSGTVTAVFTIVLAFTAIGQWETSKNMKSISQDQTKIIDEQSEIMDQQAKIMKQQANISRELASVEERRLEYQDPHILCEYQTETRGNISEINLRIVNSGQFAVVVDELLIANYAHFTVFAPEGKVESEFNGTKNNILTIVAGESEKSFGIQSNKTGINRAKIKTREGKEISCGEKSDELISLAP